MFGAQCCREVSGTIVVETCRREVLKRNVGEEGCRQVLGKRVVEKSNV